MVERIVFLHVGRACSETSTLSIRSPSLLDGPTPCSLCSLVLNVQTRFSCQNIEDTRIFWLSCNFLCTTVWANPQFCPDSWLDFYRPCVIMKIHNTAALLAFSHAAHLALFLSCSNENSIRVPLRTSLSNVPRYNVCM